jgi:hypothetical protein
MKYYAYAVIVTALLPACGGDQDAVAPGDAVWDTDVRSLEISSEGGGLAIRPPGSECAPSAAVYDFVVATRKLDSTRCEGAGGAPLLNVERSRVISEFEFDELRPLLEQLEVVKTMQCGADKPAITLRVSDGGGTTEYRDSFYSCVDDPRPTVSSDSLEAVFAKLGTFATK